MSPRTLQRHHVITAGPEQISALVELLGFALVNAAPYDWLIGDYVERRERIRPYFAHELALALERGHLLRTFKEHDGLAVWAEHPANPGDTQPPESGPDLLGRFAPYFAEFEHSRRTRRVTAMGARAHVHLRTLCARFETTGRNVETVLLEERLADLDRPGPPAYTDPSRTEVWRLLAEHGFEPVEGASPGGSAPPWPMVREPVFT